MTDAPEDTQPEGGVGYGRPPKHSQFKPGQSGNPRGRPRAARSVAEMVSDVLQEKTWIVLRGKRKRVPAVLALIYRHLEQALKGDIKSARLLLGMKASGSDHDGGSAASLLTEEDLAILASAGLLLGKGDPDVSA